MEDSSAVLSSFVIVRANVSSTSLPFATRYHASVANSSRCSSSRWHHDALPGDGVNDTDAKGVAIVDTPNFVMERAELSWTAGHRAGPLAEQLTASSTWRLLLVWRGRTT